MRARRTLSLAFAGLLWAVSSPALAATSIGPPLRATAIGLEEVLDKCAFAGITTTNGRIQFVFGGSAESFSTSTSQPQATLVRCAFVSPFQSGVPGSEPSYEQITSTSLGGAVAVTPPALTPPLQVRPAEICVSGFGVFGPIPPAENPKHLAEACSDYGINLFRSSSSDPRRDESTGLATQFAGFVLGTTMPIIPCCTSG